VSRWGKAELLFRGVASEGEDDGGAEGVECVTEGDGLREVAIDLVGNKVPTVIVEVGVADSVVEGRGKGDVATGRGLSNEPSIFSSLAEISH
jgi:hypothetical protein